MVDKIEVENWPPIEGRYTLGDKKSPVAVCTLASIDEIELDTSKIAAVGKTVTENVGIEKVVQNIVANPNIRFLILCGKESKGHYVGQAFIALKENGINKERRIINANGPIPFLKNIPLDEVERFRNQIVIINMIEEKDPNIINKKIDECIRDDPGAFKGEIMQIKQVPKVEAKYDEKFVEDPKGHFIVTPDKNSKKIIVEHRAKEGEGMKIIGGSAEEISHTIANMNLIGDHEQRDRHALYLGRELQKAELALRFNMDYEQDKDLEKKKEEPKKEEKDEYGWYD